MFSPHCSSPSTWMTAHLKTPLSSSWSLQTTPHWSASFRTVVSLPTDRRLKSWLSGAVLTTWSLTRSKPWSWSWTSGETPLLSPTHHHEQHSDCTGVIQVPGHHHLPRPEVGQSHSLHCEKGLAEVVLPSPAEEVQPATAAADTVLLCHHWIHPLHINNFLVQLSYQIWPQKTTEGSPDCWANHWYNPPHSPRTVLIQSEQKGCQNHSGPLTSNTFPLWTAAVWSTLQSSEHQNDKTQEQFLPSGNPSHEHLTLNVEHTTLLYIIYSPRILIFHFNLHISDLYTHNCLYYVVFLLFCTLPICILYIILFIICVLSCRCHSVALWSFCHYNKFLVCVNIPGQ